jgi:site-specific recombinase XerD
MIKEQEIKSLIEDCTKSLRAEGYSEDNIIVHKKLWGRGICKYMEENSIKNYNADVGEVFLQLISAKCTSNWKTFRRGVFLLTDFLFCGKIRSRIVQYVNHELSGEIGEAANNFITLMVSMRRSKRTLYAHQLILSYFIKHLSVRSVSHIVDIKEADVLSFIASVENNKERSLYTIRLFCRYLYEQGLLEKNIEYIIGRNRYPQREKLPSVYDASEIKQIELSVDQSSSVGKRDYAMLLLATRLGLRASDIAGLRFENLDWDKSIIRLAQYKTQLEIELPLLTDVGEALINYLKYGRRVSKSQNVFLSALAPYRTINWSVVSASFRRIINSSKVDVRNRKIGPHAMRHTLASRLLSNGVALPVISETLGHTNTQTTMGYLRVDINGLMNCTLDVPIVSSDFYMQKGGVFYE